MEHNRDRLQPQNDPINKIEITPTRQRLFIIFITFTDVYRSSLKLKADD